MNKLIIFPSQTYEIKTINPTYPWDFEFALNYIPGSASENVS